MLSSDCAAWQAQRVVLLVLLVPTYFAELEVVAKERRTGPLAQETLVRFGDGCLQYYCTSMVMVWVAATLAWSLLAALIVIWCSPLLRPLSVP